MVRSFRCSPFLKIFPVLEFAPAGCAEVVLTTHLIKILSLAQVLIFLDPSCTRRGHLLSPHIIRFKHLCLSPLPYLCFSTIKMLYSMLRICIQLVLLTACQYETDTVSATFETAQIKCS